MATVSFFSNGGAAIHGLTLIAYRSRRFSAWVDSSGNMIDAESMHCGALNDYHTRRVVPDSPQWDSLAKRARAVFNIDKACQPGTSENKSK